MKQKQGLLNYFNQCTNEQKNIIPQIRNYRQQDPSNISARTNLALQLILFNDSPLEAYELIFDLIGFESFNVKVLMQSAAARFNFFKTLPIETQTELLLSIANNYEICDQAFHLFFQQPYSPIMLKLKTLKNKRGQYLSRAHLVFLREILDEEIPEINELFKLSRHQKIDIDIKPNDDICYFATIQFNHYQQQLLQNEGFKIYNKKNTFEWIKNKQYQHVNQQILNHFTTEIKLYLLGQQKKDINFLSSLQIIRFNMLLLQLLNKQDYVETFDFIDQDISNDPQYIIPYLIQIISLLSDQFSIIQKIIFAMQKLKFSNNQQLQNTNLYNCLDSASTLLLKQKPCQQIIELLLPICQKIDQSIYHKFAIYNNKIIDCTKITKKQAIKNLITSILIKQDQDYLQQTLDQVYELMCNVESKNPRRNLCNFLELIYILQYKYDQKFLQSKLTEYFSYSQEDMSSTLLMIYQQLEIDLSTQQQLSFEYVSIVAKLLHLITEISQQPKHKEQYMEYFNLLMCYINNLLKKIPKIKDLQDIINQQPFQLQNPQKIKTLLINLSLIEKVLKLHYIDLRGIQTLKLSLLKNQPPTFLLIQLSKNEKEFNYLQKHYSKSIDYKELRFHSKIEKIQKQIKQNPIKLKSLLEKPLLDQFLKHCYKLFQQKHYSAITKIQILEQMISYLTSSLFSLTQKPQYQDELFEKSDIKLFKIEHKDFIQFYVNNGELFTPSMFIDYRAEAIYVYQKICIKLIKQLNNLGFFKTITKIISNISIFMQRMLCMTTLINIYSKISWYLEPQIWQQLTDQVCSVVSHLNLKINYGLEGCEKTRQSLYKQRRSYFNKLKDSHSKIMQCFDSDNILNGKFKNVFYKLCLEYLCVQNHSQPYLFDKLIMLRQDAFELQTNCQVIRNLLRCTNSKDYQYFVDENCRHELIVDQNVLNSIIPTLVIGLCSEQNNQNTNNYAYQLLLLIQNQLVSSLHNNLEQSKLYMYLYLRLKEFLNNQEIQYDTIIKCNCPIQNKYNKNQFEFDIIATLSSFQMTQKRILRQQEDLNIFKCNKLDRKYEFTSIIDINSQSDIIVICLFEFNGEKIILISKYFYQTKQCETKQINSIAKCLQFKDALLYYLRVVQENLDCMQDKSLNNSQWWQKREYYEQQLIKRQTNIENALSEHIDFIYNSKNSFLILSPQLQLLPWDHIRNVVFNRVLSLGHIQDLLNYPIDPKQDLFYILNPGADLGKTEKKLLPVFQAYNLKGITREKPNSQLIIDCLIKKDYYFYVGHGGGEQYLNEKQALQTQQFFQGRPYLLGCSSAQMIELVKFKNNNVSLQEIFLNHIDWHGLAVSYLLRGCPTLFGALWPITDKDADKYALDLIEQYADNRELKPEEIILKTKSKCALKQFNGTAFVIYGINQK